MSTLYEQAKASIGVATPVVTITLLLAALLLWRRCRKSKKASSEPIMSEDSQPYLQRKAELEAEEKKRHELEAEERRYELDGENRIHEISEEG